MLPRHPPGGIALISQAGPVSWADWDGRIDATSRRLAAQAPRGGVVAFVASDPVESALLVLGALRAGVVVAPLSARLPAPALAVRVEGLRAMLLEAAEADPSSVPRAMRRSGGVVVHTSGSMGQPKAVLLTAEALLAGAAGVVEALDLRPGDTWLLDLPMHHVAGIGVAMRCALAGAAIAVPSETESAIHAMRAMRVSHASLVDTQLHRVLRDTDPRPPSSLRVALVGGGPVSPALIDRAMDLGWPMSVSYGLTEMGSTVTATRPRADPAERYTAGRPLPDREVTILDGEIRVRGAGLFAGYLSRGRLDPALDEDGYFRTGDLGSIDREGRLVIAGRADARFISGGENVQPEEVEAALASVPGVARAVVVSVSDAEFGRRGVAFVETEDGNPPDAAGLSAALSERLERFKLPVKYLPWPAGLSGMKPDRRRLADLAEKLFGATTGERA